MRFGKIAWGGIFVGLVALTIGGAYWFKGPSASADPAPAPQVQPPAPPQPQPLQVVQRDETPPEPARPAAQPPQEISVAPGVNLEPVRALIVGGDLAGARAELARIYFDDKTPSGLRNELETMMLQISRTLVTDKPTDRDFEFYKIQSGDSLIKIAERFRVEKKYRFAQHGVLKLFNKLGNDMIRIGQTLRIPKGEVRIVVRMSQFKMLLFYEGIAFAQFPVAVGAEANATPAGVYTVGDKTAKPTWFPPESSGVKGPVGPDDPKNPLGSHWIALQHRLHTGLGIHGTNDPATIGTKASLGCVRMRNEDVKIVFECVTPGMEVHILD